MGYKIRESIIKKHKGNLDKIKRLIFKGYLEKGDFTQRDLKEIEYSMSDSYTLEDLFLDGK